MARNSAVEEIIDFILTTKFAKTPCHEISQKGRQIHTRKQNRNGYTI